jgi:lysylphosphatidylglycerol synthetase-like protein (DUF2156 family)
VNGVLFYFIALLVVAGAAAAVLAPRVRDAAIALLATTTLIAILCAASSAFTLAALQLAVPLICAPIVYVMIRRGYRGIGWPAPLLPRRWWIGAGAAGGLGLLLIIVFVASADSWFVVDAKVAVVSTSLLTVLGTLAPYALVIGAVVVVMGVAVAVLLGRTSADERESDKHLEARQAREERTRRRREDRDAARRTRGGESPAKTGS